MCYVYTNCGLQWKYRTALVLFNFREIGIFLLIMLLIISAYFGLTFMFQTLMCGNYYLFNQYLNYMYRVPTKDHLQLNLMSFSVGSTFRNTVRSTYQIKLSKTSL